MKNIFAHYGGNWLEMTKQLLAAADAARDLPAGGSVAVKPNLVVARPASGGATTHPEIVAGILEFLLDHGVRDIAVIEGSWVGDDTRRAFAACGYDALAKRYAVPLHDLKSDRAVPVSTPAGDILICEKALRADCLINVPVLKGHCQTRMTCALKNLKGCIPDGEKRRFHREGLDRLIAGLATVLRPALTVVDGICGDLDFEEGGTPVQADRILLGRDPFRLDSLGCRLLGFDPEEVRYLGLAAQWGLGDLGAEDWNLAELARPDAASASAASRRPPSASGADRIGRAVRADQACSACYAALIHSLKRLEEKGEGVVRRESIHIGQGWKGKKIAGTGIGVCCAGADKHVPGCPPSAAAVMAALTDA